MNRTKLFTKGALLLIVVVAGCVPVVAQDLSWMKGIWHEERTTPYIIPPVKYIQSLEITAVADSSFAGIQTTFLAKDTAVRISYACTGLLTTKVAQFRRGNLLYKANSSQHDFEWQDCAGCEASLCSLYVKQHKMILLLTTKDCDSACNGTIAYYRDLNEFDSLVQQQLTKRYDSTSYTSIYAAYPALAAHHSPGVGNSPNNNSATNASLNKDIPAVLRERTNKLAQTLQITSPNIEVILLDDAEIDGDIVSLYDNNVAVLSHKTLGKEVIKYNIKADKQHAYHELILVAENLGSIPPNTALMRIRAGDKKYELTTRANMHENAKIIIKYTGD